MRRTGLLAGGAVVAIVVAAAGGAYLYAQHRGAVELDRSVAQIRQQLGSNGSLEYAGSSVHPLSRSATLERVILRRPDGTRITADRIVVSPDGANGLRTLRAVNLVATSAASTVKAAQLNADRIGYDGLAGADATTFDPARLRWSSLTLGDMTLSTPGRTMAAETLRVDDYGLGHPSKMALRTVSVTMAAPVASPGSPPGPAPGGPLTAHVGWFRAEGADLATLVDAAEHGRAGPVQNTAFKAEAEAIAFDRGDRISLTVDRSEMDDQVSATGPGSIGMTIRGATSSPVTDQDGTTLKTLGLTAVHWSMTLQGNSDPTTGKARLSSWRFTARELGQVELGMEFENLFPKQLLANGTAPAAVLPLVVQTVRLAGLHVRLEDGGMLRRVFQARAQASGANPEQVRSAAAAALRSPGDRLSAARHRGARRGRPLHHPGRHADIVADAAAVDADQRAGRRGTELSCGPGR